MPRARVWALLYLLIHDLPVPEELPEAWRTRWSSTFEHGPPMTLHDPNSGQAELPNREEIARRNRQVAQHLLEAAQALLVLIAKADFEDARLQTPQRCRVNEGRIGWTERRRNDVFAGQPLLQARKRISQDDFARVDRPSKHAETALQRWILRRLSNNVCRTFHQVVHGREGKSHDYPWYEQRISGCRRPPVLPPKSVPRFPEKGCLKSVVKAIRGFPS